MISRSIYCSSMQLFNRLSNTSIATQGFSASNSMACIG